MSGVRCGPICFQNRISNVAGTICLPNGFNQPPKLRNPNYVQFPCFTISPGVKVKQISMVYEAAYHHKSLHCIGILHKMRFIWKSLDLWWNQIIQLISQSARIILEDFLNSWKYGICERNSPSKSEFYYITPINAVGHRQFGWYWYQTEMELGS